MVIHEATFLFFFQCRLGTMNWKCWLRNGHQTVNTCTTAKPTDSFPVSSTNVAITSSTNIIYYLLGITKLNSTNLELVCFTIFPGRFTVGQNIGWTTIKDWSFVMEAWFSEYQHFRVWYWFQRRRSDWSLHSGTQTLIGNRLSLKESGQIR